MSTPAERDPFISSLMRATRPTILIVDDDNDAHRLTHLALRPLGARFCSAWDGATALGVARKEEPDLIILDLGLPAGDGLTILNRLRHLPGLAHVPTLVVSARDLQLAGSAVLEAGAAGYLQKPVEPPVFLATVERLLRVDDAA